MGDPILGQSESSKVGRETKAQTFRSQGPAVTRAKFPSGRRVSRFPKKQGDERGPVCLASVGQCCPHPCLSTGGCASVREAVGVLLEAATVTRPGLGDSPPPHCDWPGRSALRTTSNSDMQAPAGSLPEQTGFGLDLEGPPGAARLAG